MAWSSDPVWDWEQKCKADDERLKDLPVCDLCGEPIQQDDAVCIDGKWYCDNCLREERRCIA